MPNSKEEGLPQAEILAMQNVQPSETAVSTKEAVRREAKKIANAKYRKNQRINETPAEREERLKKRRIYAVSRRKELEKNDYPKYEQLLKNERKYSATHRAKIKGDDVRYAKHLKTDRVRAAKWRKQKKKRPNAAQGATSGLAPSAQHVAGTPEAMPDLIHVDALTDSERRNLEEVRKAARRMTIARYEAKKWRNIKGNPDRHKDRLTKRKKWDATYIQKRNNNEEKRQHYLDYERKRGARRRAQKKALQCAAQAAAADRAPSAEQAAGMHRTMPPLMLVSALTDAEKKHLKKVGEALSQADPAVQSLPDSDNNPLINRDPLRKKMNLQKVLDLSRLQEHSATDTAVAAVGAPMSGIDEGNNYDRFTSPALTRKRPAGQTFRTDDMQPDIEYKKPKRTPQLGK